jgi:hypothetical protein
MSFLPPEISIFDMEIGKLEEQKRQLELFRRSYNRRRDISSRISDLETQINKLQVETDRLSADVSFVELENLLGDKVNTYLNELNTGDPTRWQHGRVEVKITTRKFEFTINGVKWSSQIGFTSQALVLLGYHYALLSLSSDRRFNYPGLSIIDFPLELVDSKTIRDSENYLIEPFIRLCQKEDMKHTQLIVAGRSFENLKGVNRRNLPEIWNAGSLR